VKNTPFLETVRTTLFSLVKHLETKEEQRRINSSFRGKKPQTGYVKYAHLLLVWNEKFKLRYLPYREISVTKSQRRWHHRARPYIKTHKWNYI